MVILFLLACLTFAPLRASSQSATSPATAADDATRGATGSSAGDATLVSFDFVDANLQDVLRALAAQQGVTILGDKDVGGKVTLHASGLPFNEALRLLLDANGLAYTQPSPRVFQIHKAPAPPPYELSVANDRVSCTARNADLLPLLYDFGRKAGFNVIPDAGVQGQVNALFRNLPVLEALDALLTPLGFSYVPLGQDPPTYRIVRSADYKVSVSVEPGGLLDLSAQNAPFSAIADELVQKAGVNLILDPALQGTVSLNVQRVSMQTLLEALFATRGYEVSTSPVPLAQTPPPGPGAAKQNPIYWVRRGDTRPQPGIETLVYENGLLTLTVRDVSVFTLLQQLAAKTGINVIADRDSSTATVTGTLTRVPLDDALRLFFEANGFQVISRAGVYQIRRSPLSNALSITANKDGTFDLDLTNVELTPVLRELANRADVDLVISGYVRGQVGNLRLSGVTLEQAFDYLLGGAGFSWRKEGKVYLVGGGVGSPPDGSLFASNKLFTLKYLTPEALLAILPAYIPPQGLRLVKDQNAVLASGSDSYLRDVQDFIAAADVPNTRLVTQVFNLQYLDPNEAGTILARQFPGLAIQVLKARNALVVRATPEVCGQIRDCISALDQPGGARREIFSLQHLKAEDAVKLLPEPFSKENLVVLPAQNAFVATGSPDYLASLRSYLGQIDVPTPQILFDVLVVEYLDSGATKAGLQIASNAGRASISFKPLTSEPFVATLNANPAAPSLDVTLNALVQQGRAKVLANPKISVLSGHSATFAVLTKSRYWEPRVLENTNNGSGGTGGGVGGGTGSGGSGGSGGSVGSGSPGGSGGSGRTGGSAGGIGDVAAFRTIETGVRLSIQPWVSASGEITMEIQPEISDSAGSSSSGLPQTNERTANTTIRVLDGETVIIGGLIQNTRHRDRNRVPILSDLPVIGLLLQNLNEVETQSEFVIYITPHLVKSAGEANQFFRPAWSAPESSLNQAPSQNGLGSAASTAGPGGPEGPNVTPADGARAGANAGTGTGPKTGKDAGPKAAAEIDTKPGSPKSQGLPGS